MGDAVSEYAEDDVEKLSVIPLVQDTTHPDIADDDDSPAGALVALDGPPVNGGVPTYNSGTKKHTSVVPSGGSGSTATDPYSAALRMDGDARVREAALSTSTTTSRTTDPYFAARQADADARLREASVAGTLDEQQVALLAQFYGA
jgi:hypothetical protein